MPKKIAVIDGNSLMHRAYHAVPPTMNAPDGRPPTPCSAFCPCSSSSMKTPDLTPLSAPSTQGVPVFRMKALEQYKAQRPPMDDAPASVQFPVIEEPARGHERARWSSVKGWEGDDVLGTIAARDEELGYETLLVTGDKDAYQLAS